MVDITKEEFWDNKYQEVYKKEKQNSKIKELINKHKVLTILLISFGVLMAVNTILIYNFFKILTEI